MFTVPDFYLELKCLLSQTFIQNSNFCFLLESFLVHLHRKSNVYQTIWINDGLLMIPIESRKAETMMLWTAAMMIDWMLNPNGEREIGVQFTFSFVRLSF